MRLKYFVADKTNHFIVVNRKIDSIENDLHRPQTSTFTQKTDDAENLISWMLKISIAIPCNIYDSFSRCKFL